MEKYPGSLALQARPYEEAGEEKEQRHQEDVLPRTKQVEAEPPRVIDHRKGAPKVRGVVEREWRGRQEIQVGQNGMKRKHEKDDNCPQIVERPTGPRSHRVGSKRGTH